MNSNNQSLSACVRYFKERPEFERAFSLMRDKWKRYGRPSGNIEIKHPSKEEREILGGFIGKDFYDGPLRFPMRQFEDALKETRFRELPLKEILAKYYGEEMVTNKDERQKRKKRREVFLTSLCETAERILGRDSDAYRWLAEGISQKRYGYHLILREYEKSPKATGGQVEKVCRALEWLKLHKNIRLAVLGAEITRNPHEFDRDTFSGKLLIQALSCVHGGMECKNAEDILTLYYTAGIRPDDISSFTAAYGIHLYLDEGEHPAYKSFIGQREPYVVTLSNLARIKRADAKHKKVYIVENQMVFSHLCEEVKGEETAILCTSGRIKTASLMLLDLLSRSGCLLYYSGDFDPEGLDIAEKLLMRYPDTARLWCMEPQDYRYAISDEAINDERMRTLENIRLPCFEKTKNEIKRYRKAGYQERLIEKMIREITGGGA